MGDTIRNYKNKIFIDFVERGDNFSLQVPHYKKWLSIIQYLRCRGFKVGKNETYEINYKCLSPFHKIGFKKNTAVLMELGPGRIEVEFGNIKNLWEPPMQQSFWSNLNDDRYTKLSYLEDKAVSLEIIKLIRFCQKFSLQFIKEDSDLSPEERIVKKLRNNTHIHGVVNSLNDIAVSMDMDSYNKNNNSSDRDKKRIICGQTKYFYNYAAGNRLCKGVVWHNINNMWWIISAGKLHNVAMFDLFDADENTPQRKPPSPRYINQVIDKFVSKKDYIRAHRIQQFHRNLLNNN